MSEIIPLHNFVLIAELEKNVFEPLTTNIVLPDTANAEPSDQGKVIKIGEKVSLPIQEGDTVLFRRYKFETLIVGKEIYLIGKDEDIVAILK